MEKNAKEKLIKYIEQLPDDIQVFKREGDEYDVVQILLFTKPKDDEFLTWYFGP